MRGVGFMLGFDEMSAGVLLRDPVIEWMDGDDVTSGENFMGDVGGVATLDFSFLKLNILGFLCCTKDI